MEWIEKTAERIAQNAIIRAVRRGLLYMMPMVLIGSVVLMLLNLPVSAFQSMMDRALGGEWRTVALTIYNGTFQIMSLTALLTISYTFSQEQPLILGGEVNLILVLITAFSSFVVFFGQSNTLVSQQDAASTGLPGAIIVAVLSVKLFLFFYRRLPHRLKMFAFDADTILMSSLNALLPVFATVLLFGLARLLYALLGIGAFLGTVHGWLGGAFNDSSGGVLSTLMYHCLTHILWFFGLHGTNLFEGFARDIFVSASNTNIELAAASMVPTEIFTKEFIDCFVYLGGAGATLGLLLALMLAGKRSNVNRLANYSLLPGIFNINEMMVYGLPIILTPYYLVPFLLTPAVLIVTTFISMFTGLVPMTIHRVEWTTPIFVSGYISTGSIAGVLLQAVNLMISVFIYLPFIRLYERNIERGNRETFETLAGVLKNRHQVQDKILITRSDQVGALTRALSAELKDGLDHKKPGLHLEYQPKVNAFGQVSGAEALLRWSHPFLGYVSPLVALDICEEAGLTNQLGAWIINSAFDDLRKWNDMGLKGLSLSVNLTPQQLYDDPKLVQMVRDCIARTKLDPRYMELEITEHAAVDQSKSTRQKLKELKQMGLNISIDDFGMGNSSLLYIRDLYANVVKIDISLVQGVVTDIYSQEIIKSIMTLCSQLSMSAVAEGVENREQQVKLEELGCSCYQGFHYSRPLPFDTFVEYVNQHGIAMKEES